MLKLFAEKLKEAGVAVLPILLLVVALSFTPIFSLTALEICAFLFGGVMLIIGIALFNLGADYAMTPMGKHIGSGLTKQNKLPLLLGVSLIIGILVTVSEPDLEVLASQLSAVVNNTLLIVIVGVGVGLFLVVAIIKIFFKKSLSTLVMFFYLLLFALAVLVNATGNADFLPLAFDSGGVTTGPITVPFIMALGVGIAGTLSSRDSKENSFGLIALCSVGAVVAVLILSIFFKGSITYEVDDGHYLLSDNFFLDFIKAIPTVAGEVALSMGLIVAMFFICQVTFLKLNRQTLLSLLVGIVLTFFGLTIFLSSVNSVFMSVGYKLGSQIASSSPVVVVGFAFILGALVVLAEPAIHVLVKQVEEVTNGGVSKRAMLISLAIGVGLALAVSALRIVIDLDLMYIVVPGYIISLALSLFVPPVYTAIAFDSGGVASGPLTSCFVLPFMIGLCSVVQGEDAVLRDAFGVVALVAMIPLITIQMLGFGAMVRKQRERKIIMRALSKKDDCEIIYFD